MIVVDSSGWLEYFGGAHPELMAPAVETQATILVPTIVLYEVYKRFLQSRSRNEAETAAAHLSQFTVVEMSSDIALLGAELSLQHKLPMADSLILATAQTYNAELWTLDADFKEIPGVHYVLKK